MNDISSFLTALLSRLCRAVGAVMVAQARGPQLVWLGTRAFAPAPQPNRRAALPNETWFLLTQRLDRLAHRFRSLFARYQAATPLTPRPSRPHCAPDRARAPYLRLPAASGWINARIPDAAPSAGTLEMLLQTPEMRDFVTAAPQAGRLLRPLCRMLGLAAPPWLRLPPPPCAPRRKPAIADSPATAPTDIARPPTTPAPTPAPTPDRPIPRHILAAARAWRAKTR